ncbi:MAG: hypothetical protein F4X47_08445 [Gammaproteobacteria bacterium]|nr:hypothetical protein [Gammaproteobacteria bacterium]MYC52331.1 hypothetical protein [Gammaproteobacteria bacterium]
MISALLTLFAVGLVTLLVVGVLLAVAGTVFSIGFGLASFLLFKVAPIALLGYVVLRLIAPRKRKELSESDRKWLEG